MEKKANIALKQYWQLLVNYLTPHKGQVSLLAFVSVLNIAFKLINPQIVKYFLDSAILEEINYAYTKWGIAGVTTNPNHILSTGKTFYEVVEELCDHFKGKTFPISVEINLGSQHIYC